MVFVSNLSEASGRADDWLQNIHRALCDIDFL